MAWEKFVDSMQQDLGGNMPDLTQSLLDEYMTRSKRKNEDEKWLKENRPIILKAMEAIGKNIEDFGNKRVQVVIPDASKWDDDKLMEFLVEKDLVNDVCDFVAEVNEERLAALIENGTIDLDELKKYAWVEAKGAPRLTVKEVK